MTREARKSDGSEGEGGEALYGGGDSGADGGSGGTEQRVPVVVVEGGKGEA